MKELTENAKNNSIFDTFLTKQSQKTLNKKKPGHQGGHVGGVVGGP